MYLLGYIPADSRLYLGDKELNVVSFQLLLSVLEYQTAVMRRDFETADKVTNTEETTYWGRWDSNMNI
jgi:coatomer subunit beta'